MGRRCTNMKIPNKGAISIGTPSSTIADAPRLPTSCWAAGCSGSIATASTACAWTRLLPCCISNRYGGRENLDAINLLRRFNTELFSRFPNATTAAEESTAWPMVSRPVEWGGLGFGYKWNMGWMHDTLEYISKDPIYRKHHHGQILFGLHYAFFENFILPLSHDEVVHGKRSILGRMPGDEWQRFANLRAYYGFMFGHPGKKLLFMGSEFGQENEWRHDHSLDWHLLEQPRHAGIQALVRDLNRLYRTVPALHA